MKQKLKRRYALYVTACLKMAEREDLPLSMALGLGAALSENLMLRREERRYGAFERPELAEQYGTPETAGVIWIPVLSGRGKLLHWVTREEIAADE